MAVLQTVVHGGEKYLRSGNRCLKRGQRAGPPGEVSSLNIQYCYPNSWQIVTIWIHDEPDPLRWQFRLWVVFFKLLSLWVFHLATGSVKVLKFRWQTFWPDTIIFRNLKATSCGFSECEKSRGNELKDLWAAVQAAQVWLKLRMTRGTQFVQKIELWTPPC